MLLKTLTVSARKPAGPVTRTCSPPPPVPTVSAIFWVSEIVLLRSALVVSGTVR